MGCCTSYRFVTPSALRQPRLACALVPGYSAMMGTRRSPLRSLNGGVGLEQLSLGCAPPAPLTCCARCDGGAAAPGGAALVKALAVARAEAAELRERLAAAATRGVAVSRERHALAARCAELQAQTDALRVEALEAAQRACGPGEEPVAARAGAKRALAAALDARRAAEAKADALAAALAAARSEAAAAAARAQAAEAGLEDADADLAELRFQLRLAELQRGAARLGRSPRTPGRRTLRRTPLTPP